MQMLSRREVPVEETWDLSLIYEDEQEMWAALERTKEETAGFSEKYLGKLNTASMIVNALDELEAIEIAMDRIGSYVFLAMEADYTDNEIRARGEKVSDELTRLESELTFVDSEILAAPEEELKTAVETAGGSRVYLQDLLAKKAHRLSPETEKVLAALGKAFSTPYTVYNTMKLADITFPSFAADGKEYPLGYSLYEDNYAYEADTAVRRAAFRTFADTLKKYRNTTAAAYNACVSQEKTFAEIRGFANVFDSLLFDQKVTREMYDRQIDLITERLAPHMRRYAKLLGKVHGLDKVTFADLKLPLDPFSERITWRWWTGRSGSAGSISPGMSANPPAGSALACTAGIPSFCSTGITACRTCSRSPTSWGMPGRKCTPTRRSPTLTSTPRSILWKPRPRQMSCCLRATF